MTGRRSQPQPARGASTANPATRTMPPTSKTQPYYSVSPEWADVKPIPQVDSEAVATYTSHASPTIQDSAKRLAAAAPPLATIAYTPRYTEAMSYLRAVMAANEFSERALALTEDIISMNPAHYTVWIYRFRTLQVLWGVEDLPDVKARHPTTDERVISGVETELEWLDAVSTKNLKNYQIWHHRTGLLSLLPTPPPGEQDFLAEILSLDTKNYHVWSYRQWLVTRFPSVYLTHLDDEDSELAEMTAMISDDMFNNSAWNHRYFILFGHKEIEAVGSGNRRDRSTWNGKTALTIDEAVVDREIAYVKEQISVAPQNGSSWNYLKGVLHFANRPVTSLEEFCLDLVGPGPDFSQQHDEEAGIHGVRSSMAIEMLIDIYDAQARRLTSGEGEETRKEDAKVKVREAVASLSDRWDPIRKNYWEWKLKKLEVGWA